MDYKQQLQPGQADAIKLIDADHTGNMIANQAILNATPEHAHFERATLERIANPRQRRALSALLPRPLTRKQLDEVVGCNNSPDLVMKLREFGLQIPCTRQPVVDRDGKMTWYGIYSLTAEDKTIARTALGNGGRK